MLSVLIAGNFSFAQHLKHYDLPTILPHDIDIFALHAHDLDVIYHAYAPHLIATFRSLRLTHTSSDTSRFEGCDASHHAYEFRRDALRSNIRARVGGYARPIQNRSPGMRCDNSDAEVFE